MEELVEQISELNKDILSDHLCIYGLESRLNAGADEISIGELIVRSPDDPKAHMVEVQGEASNFGGFFYLKHTFENTPTHQERIDDGGSHGTQERPGKPEDVGGLSNHRLHLLDSSPKPLWGQENNKISHRLLPNIWKVEIQEFLVRFGI